MLKRVVVVVLLLGSTAVEAQEIHVYRCDAPRGYRADFPAPSKPEGIKWETDSFSITPTVIWNEADPRKLLVSWGHTVPPGSENLQQLKDSRAFKEATVVSRDEHSIQAVYAQCATCTTHLFGLFPKLQLFTMSDVSYVASSKLGAVIGGVRAFATLCKRLR
jgi:hypothetical protein